MVPYKKDKYCGSYICILSAQLFLLASICNFYWKNYIECIIIFIMYISSVNYHIIPTLQNKAIDEFLVKINMSIGIIISLYYYNVLPTLCAMLIIYMYYLEIRKFRFVMNSIKSNIYHSIFIHFIAFLGFMSFNLN